jgi:hypothetical protein
MSEPELNAHINGMRFTLRPSLLVHLNMMSTKGQFVG